MIGLPQEKWTGSQATADPLSTKINQTIKIGGKYGNYRLGINTLSTAWITPLLP